MHVEGGDRVDASDSPKQVDEYHLSKILEGRPAQLSADNAIKRDRTLMHKLFA
jgi:hypothetical protein